MLKATFTATEPITGRLLNRRSKRGQKKEANKQKWRTRSNFFPPNANDDAHLLLRITVNGRGAISVEC